MQSCLIFLLLLARFLEVASICSAGQGSVDNGVTCIACPPGRYNSAASNAACPVIPAGSYGTHTVTIGTSTLGSKEWWGIAASQDFSKLITMDRHRKVYRSTDYGANWAEMPGAGNHEWLGVASSDDFTKIVLSTYRTDDATSFGQIYRSLDSGATFAVTSAPPKHYISLHCNADMSKIAACATNSIWISMDSGDSWTISGAPNKVYHGITSSVDFRKLAACVPGEKIYLSVDSGKSWAATGAPSNRWLDVAGNADLTKMVATAYSSADSPVQKIFLTVNGGASWATIGTSLALNWRGIFASRDFTRIAAASVSGAIHYSYDSGATWSYTGTKDLGIAVAGGATAARACPANTFSLGSSSMCTPCAIGRYAATSVTINGNSGYSTYAIVSSAMRTFSGAWDTNPMHRESTIDDP